MAWAPAKARPHETQEGDEVGLEDGKVSHRGTGWSEHREGPASWEEVEDTLAVPFVTRVPDVMVAGRPRARPVPLPPQAGRSPS